MLSVAVVDCLLGEEPIGVALDGQLDDMVEHCRLIQGHHLDAGVGVLKHVKPPRVARTR
jgi:hypothetical protein